VRASTDPIRSAIAAALAKREPALVELSRELHAHPELALVEHRAAGLLCDLLEREGFTVERGIAGLDTAFRAELGSGSPKVAFLCEYDALPEIGHGCGHNLIAMGGLAAAVALAAASAGVTGTVCVIGTPGEEGAGGKITELEHGVFDDVDAALMFHPGDRTMPIRHATASQTLTVEFHGVAAHAAGSPQDGRSALAAMIQLFVAVDAMRQFVPDTARLHGIITDGGTAANVVPEYTRAEFQVRDITQQSVLELLARFRAAVEAAAQATGTRSELTLGPLYAERKNNHVLAGRTADYLRDLGVTVEQPVLRGGTGSSDIGNVSLVLPTIHPYLQVMPTGTPSHSRQMTDYVVTDEAHSATLKMAEALACTAADVMSDAEFLDSVRADFDERTPDYPA
jgi:amidohydrolase